MSRPEHEQAILIGGDAAIIKKRLAEDPLFAAAYQRTEAVNAIEVPCQMCGRMCLVAPSGQSLALGEPTAVVTLDIDSNGKPFAKPGTAKVVTGGAAVLCMWCAFRDKPDLLAVIEKQTL